MKLLITKIFGVNTVKPLSTMSCERTYCSASASYDTLYEYMANGSRIKRGCC